MIGGLLPAFVASVTDDDRKGRLYRISIPGLTDGAAVMPRAQVCYPVGDESEHTEIRIPVGARVWVAFEGGDPRFPVIVGFRPKNEENDLDWRRFYHANFQFNADNTFEIIAGTQVTVKTPLALIDAENTHCTKNLTVDGLLTFNGGMQGKAGPGGGPAMIVSGGAAFSDDVTAGGTSVHGHGHIEQGDGKRVSDPVA
jgi:hypothetical protein